ncbi:MAG: phospholipid/cholesterol/gamma-HCH transport system substrate-binding protein [Gammaproteobacteria bacterium]|jgi:phospholipid/cholesterol/gamma-HCH transport system substrate-binding protein
MPERSSVELSVGLFVSIGIAALVYLAVNLGDLQLLSSDGYLLKARFVSSSGLIEGAFVEVGGVRVGTVAKIAIDYDSYESIVEMKLDERIKLQDDAIASIRTSGIIGDKFVKIAPGGSETLLEHGGEIFETESSINLEELISKYIFESNDKD